MMIIAPLLLSATICVGTREAPLGVDGAGLETVSGDVRLRSMDAEYDVATDTLVKLDGTTPVTNEHYLARRYDCALAPLNAEGVFRTPPVGWMTWYSVKFDASETTILENAKAFKEAFGGYTDEKPVLWVDWEWFHRRFNSKGEDGEDMLTPHAASYPRGLKALADDLKVLGFTPALWVSPQVDVRTNALFAAHPEWILVRHPFWGGHVFADPTATGYLDDFVKPLFRRYRSWGYEAFKWDCMPYTMWMYDLYHDRFHDKSVSTKEAYRRLVAAGREAVGPDAYLESCSGTGDDPMLWSADAFDAARVGSDIFAWYSFAAEGVDMLLRYYPLHNLFLRCDADNLVLREEYNTLEQARTRVSIYALTGVPITVGDSIDALDAPRIRMLRKAMPVVPMRAASLRPYVRKGNVLSLTAHFARDWGGWQVRSWSNLATDAVERVSFDIPPDHAVWDFWNDRLLSADGGKLSFELGPCASRIVRVTPLAKAAPTLLSISRHITQGGYELKGYTATESVVRGVVRCPGGETVKVTFLLPEGTKVASASHPYELSGRVLRMRIGSDIRDDVAFALELKRPSGRAKVAPFRDGETVVFLGDSITHGGRYVADLQLYWSLRHPGSDVKLHNAGICGQRANHGLIRYDWDVAPLKPDRVFILFGMNDVARDDRWAPPDTPEKLKRRADLTHTYVTNLTALVRKVRASGAVPVVMTPTPFDQYSDIPKANRCPGTDDPGLKSFAAKAREVAASEGVECVELYEELLPILKSNPEKVFLKDRVHPGHDGHLLMAALILKAMGEGVATDVTAFDASSGARKFTYSPKRLPYPTCAEYAVADSVMPLTEGWNREIVRITGLPEGCWTLRLGGADFGAYSAAALAAGVNVTVTNETRFSPSLKAAKRAWTEMSAFHSEQNALRVLAQTFYQVRRLGGDIDSLDSCLEKYNDWIEVYRQKPETMQYYTFYGNQIPAFKKKYLDRENALKRIEKHRAAMAAMRAEPYEISVRDAK